MSIDPTAAWKSLAAQFLADSSDEDDIAQLKGPRGQNSAPPSLEAARTASDWISSEQQRSPTSVLSSRRNASLLKPNSPGKPVLGVLDNFASHPQVIQFMHQAKEGRAFSESDKDLIILAQELDVMAQELAVELMKYKSNVYLEKIDSLLKSAKSQSIDKISGFRDGFTPDQLAQSENRHEITAPHTAEMEQLSTNKTEKIKQQPFLQEEVAIIDNSSSPEPTASYAGIRTRRSSASHAAHGVGSKANAVGHEVGGRGPRRSVRLRNAPKRFSYREVEYGSQDSSEEEYIDDATASHDGEIHFFDADSPFDNNTSATIPANHYFRPNPRKRRRFQNDLDSDVEIIDIISGETTHLRTQDPEHTVSSATALASAQHSQEDGNANNQSPLDEMEHFRLLREQQKRKFELAMRGQLTSRVSDAISRIPNPSICASSHQNDATTPSSVALLPSYSRPVLVQFQHIGMGLPDILFLTNLDSTMPNIVEQYGTKLSESVSSQSMPDPSKAIFRYEGEILSRDGIFSSSGIDTDLDMVGSKNFHGTSYPLYIIDVSFPRK